MSEQVFVRGGNFQSVERAIREVLTATDAGDFDSELRKVGVTRQADVSLATNLKIEGRGQGLSPDEWVQIVVTFGPLVTSVAKDIWQIVVIPRLKRLFPSDNVSPHDPRKSRK